MVCDSTGKVYLNQCVFWKSVCRAVINQTIVPQLVSQCAGTGFGGGGGGGGGLNFPITIRDKVASIEAEKASTTTLAPTPAPAPLAVAPLLTTELPATAAPTHESKTSEPAGLDHGSIVLRSLDAVDPFQTVIRAADALNGDPLVTRDLSDR